MLKLGNITVSDLKLGTTQITKAYLGSNLVWQKQQPLPYDAEVQYLECNGRSYVETGLSVVNYVGYPLEIKYRFTEYIHTESWCIGYWNTTPEWRIYLAGHYFENLRCGVGPDNSTYHCSVPFDTNWHVAELKLDGAYFDGVKGADTNLYAMPAPTTPSIWLGRSSHADGNTIRQIEYCKMWTVEGTLVRDFIPVRFTDENSQTRGAFYDKVTNQLFKNAGSVNFTIGPDKT